MLSLGVGTDGECSVTQEERENHFHIIGTTGEGKSMLLLWMLMQDIDRMRSKKENGPGVCFIDGSENGDTMYKVLGYCEHVGFKRVLIVDPFSRFTFKKIAAINPIHAEPSLITESVDNLIEVFEYIFGVNDPAKTSVIEHYLPAFFRILATAGLTLNDMRDFTGFEKWDERKRIYAMANDPYSVEKLQAAYKNQTLFMKEIGSTLRRIDTAFRNEGLRLILSHRKGVDFAKLIADRWLILVNPSKMTKLPGRLLSAVVISEIIFGINRLLGNGWRGNEYLYIDEAARYATGQITDVLDYMRKIGLRLVLSHQDLGQFTRDEELAKAIKGRAKTKVGFYIADNEERMRMVKMFYGGHLDPNEINYNLSKQPKQNAVVKLGKDDTRLIKIHDTPVYKVSEDYLAKIYASPWYYTHEEITKDEHDRFSGQTIIHTQTTTRTHKRTTSKADGSKDKHRASDAKPDESKGTGRVKASAKSKLAFDAIKLAAERKKQDPGLGVDTESKGTGPTELPS
jgi:hypothetical protein